MKTSHPHNFLRLYFIENRLKTAIKLNFKFQISKLPKQY